MRTIWHAFVVVLFVSSGLHSNQLGAQVIDSSCLTQFKTSLKPLTDSTQLLNAINGIELLPNVKLKQVSFKKYGLSLDNSHSVEYLNNGLGDSRMNGLYSRNTIAANILLVGIPLKTSVSLGSYNKTFLFQYDLVSISFDKNAFTNSMKDKALQSLGNYDNLSAYEKLQVYGLIDSMAKFDSIKAILYDTNTVQTIKSYKKTSQGISKQSLTDTAASLVKTYVDTSSLKDSVSQLLNLNRMIGDSAKVAKKDSLVRSAKDSLQRYYSYYKMYDSLQAFIKSNGELVKKIAENKDWIEKVKAVASINELQKILPIDVLKNVISTKLENKLAGVENFSLGKSTLNRGEFTLHNQPFFGANTEWFLKQKYFVAGGTGMTTQFNAMDFYQYRNALSNLNNLTYISLGLGHKDTSHIHLTYQVFHRFFSKPETQQTTFNSQYNTNCVLGMEGVYKYRKIAFYAEAALSNTNFDRDRKYEFNPIGRKINNEPLVINYAVKSGMKFEVEKIQSTFGLNSKITSPTFRTVGNPFMFGGIVDTRLEAQKKFFSGMFNLQGLLSHQIINWKENSGRFHSISGMLAGNLSVSSFNLLMSYNPMKQFGGIIKGGITNHTFMLVPTSNYAMDERGNSGTSSLNVVWTKTTSANLADAPSSQSNIIQIGYEQSFSLVCGLSLSASAGANFMNYAQVKNNTSWGNARIGFNGKKVRVNTSVRISKTSLSGMNYQSSGDVAVNIWKSLSAVIRGDCSYNQSSSFSFLNYSVMGGISHQINLTKKSN